MKILIDGDSCNVIRIIEKIAKENEIDCHIYANFYCNIKSKYSTIHNVDCSKDSADFAIVNNCEANDIVITNDGGLASMVLSKKATPIATNGKVFTEYNIMRYLNSRYVRCKETRRTNKHQVKRLPLEHDTYDEHPPFYETLTNIIHKHQSE